MKFNAENYEENASFGIIPIGDHVVRITEAQEKISKTSGNNMIELVVQPTDEKIKGKLWFYIVDDKYATQKIGDVLRSCGIDYKSIKGEVNAKTFLGLVGKVRVKHSKGQDGNDRAEINYWIKAEGAPKPISSAATKPASEDIPF